MAITDHVYPKYTTIPQICYELYKMNKNVLANIAGMISQLKM